MLQGQPLPCSVALYSTATAPHACLSGSPLPLQLAMLRLFCCWCGVCSPLTFHHSALFPQKAFFFLSLCFFLISFIFVTWKSFSRSWVFSHSPSQFPINYLPLWKLISTEKKSKRRLEKDTAVTAPQ